MSKYKTVNIRLTSEEALKQALEAMAARLGKTYEHHEAHDGVMRAYGGSDGPKATFIVRANQFRSRYSEDIGFQRQEDGSFNLIMSTHDGEVAKPILEEVQQQYTRNVYINSGKKNGMTLLKERVLADGSISVKLKGYRRRG